MSDASPLAPLSKKQIEAVSKEVCEYEDRPRSERVAITARILGAFISHEKLRQRVAALEAEQARLTANYKTLEAGIRHMVFSCPHCGEPWAVTTEREVDIHSGAVYSCDGCKGDVIFSAQTPDQYAKQFAQPTREAVAKCLGEREMWTLEVIAAVDVLVEQGIIRP